MKSSDLERSIATLASLPSAPIAIFQLLVLVSGLLSPEDCEALGPILWDHFLDEIDPNSLSPVRNYATFSDHTNMIEGILFGYAMCRERRLVFNYPGSPERPYGVWCSAINLNKS